jgi:hypothetical protein
MAKKKEKNGKIISLYLSKDTINKACLINWGQGRLFTKNKSKFIEELIKQEFERWEDQRKKAEQ